MKQDSVDIPVTTSPRNDRHGCSGIDLSTVLADGALPVATPIADEHDLLVGLEARLADGVRDFVGALIQFGGIAQTVHKELPLSSEFGKHITLLLSTFSLQIAYALLKDGDLPLLLDDG